MSVFALAPISLESLGGPGSVPDVVRGGSAIATPQAFASLLTDGLADVEAKVAQADSLSRAFVLDDSVPVHQVTYALEQARMSLELMLQVRSRVIESYQQLMTMQL
jgi:flagellar hook-basal body complex protein FliE